MFDFRSLLISGTLPLALLTAGCAGGPGGPEAIDRTIATEVREGRREGFPDLAALRLPEGETPSTAEIRRALEALEEEAETLHLLRAAAVRPPRTSAIEAKRDALAREIEALRAEIAARPPIDRGPF